MFDLSTAGCPDYRKKPGKEKATIRIALVELQEPGTVLNYYDIRF
jgi:hypothetical protein